MLKCDFKYNYRIMLPVLIINNIFMNESGFTCHLQFGLLVLLIVTLKFKNTIFFKLKLMF